MNHILLFSCSWNSWHHLASSFTVWLEASNWWVFVRDWGSSDQAQDRGASLLSNDDTEPRQIILQIYQRLDIVQISYIIFYKLFSALKYKDISLILLNFSSDLRKLVVVWLRLISVLFTPEILFRSAKLWWINSLIADNKNEMIQQKTKSWLVSVKICCLLLQN